MLFVACGGMLALLMPSQCFHAQDEKKMDPFERTVQTFSLDRQTVFEAIARLHEATGVVVSVERSLTATQVTQADQEFTATIAGGKTEVVLNEICALDGRCAWTRDGNMVNIYPRKVKADPNYVFNRKISVFQLDNVADAGTAAIRAMRETTGPPAQLVVLEAGNYDFAAPWTVKFTDVTLRQAINRIAAHLCGTCGWQLTGTKAAPTIIFYRNLQAST